MKNTFKINIVGMVCDGCSKRIEKALQEISGVLSVQANHENGTVLVTANEKIQKELIEQKILELGFELKEETK